MQKMVKMQEQLLEIFFQICLMVAKIKKNIKNKQAIKK